MISRPHLSVDSFVQVKLVIWSILLVRVTVKQMRATMELTVRKIENQPTTILFCSDKILIHKFKITKNLPSHSCKEALTRPKRRRSSTLRCLIQSHLLTSIIQSIQKLSPRLIWTNPKNNRKMICKLWSSDNLEIITMLCREMAQTMAS